MSFRIKSVISFACSKVAPGARSKPISPGSIHLSPANCSPLSMAFAGDIPLQRRFTLRAEGHRYPPAENELCLSEGVNPTRGAYLERSLQMTTTETYRYRGYDIVPMWQWSSWCT